MISKATLTRPWRSPRGNLYPSGTVFIFKRKLGDVDSSLYDFNIPNGNYGFVILSNKIFKKLEPEELYLRQIRKKLREEHIKKTIQLFNI